MNISTDISVWVAFAFTIAVFSGFFKENIFYRFAESVFIGVSAGYFACIWLFSVIMPAIDETQNGNYILLIPVISGLLLFIPSEGKNRYTKLIFLPASFIVVAFLAVNIPVYFEVFIYEMIKTSIIPIISIDENGRIIWDLTINAFVSVVGVVSVLWFFISRHQRTGIVQFSLGETGRFYVLVAIGASFGYTLISRAILLIGRFDFIIMEVFGFRF